MTIKVPERLAAEAQVRGVSVEVYVQELLARQALENAGDRGFQSVRAAVDRILEMRKGNRLEGVRIKDVIH